MAAPLNQAWEWPVDGQPVPLSASQVFILPLPLLKLPSRQSPLTETTSSAEEDSSPLMVHLLISFYPQ